jgi:hypothetical protein
MPEGVETHAVCTESGLIATDCCPDTTTEIFLAGATAGAETCGEHICRPSFKDLMEGVINIVPGF